MEGGAAPQACIFGIARRGALCKSEWAARARRLLKFCEMQVHLSKTACMTDQEKALRNQPQSVLAMWFKERVNRNGGRLKMTTIVALARKLLVRYGNM